MKRRLLLVAAAAGFLAAAAFAYHQYRQWDRARDVLPSMQEIPPGPRAPTGSNALLGVVIGKSTYAEANGALAKLGVECKDTSMRAAMQAKRDEIKANMAEAEAKGEDPDGVTGASMADYHSKKEQNPQVRLSCDGVPASALTDRARPDFKGRILVILDSAQLPVRHTSYAQRVTDQAEAARAFREAVEAFTKTFGAPTRTTGGEPGATGDAGPDADLLPKGRLFLREWMFADLRVEVSALRLGATRTTVRETIEVPWPVRSDAPTLDAFAPRGPPVTKPKSSRSK